MFNLKNRECQKKFTEVTNKTKILSSAFRDDENLNISANRFIKRLNKILHSCFKRVRIGGKKQNSRINELFEKRTALKFKKDKSSRDELLDVENELAELCAEENMKKIGEEVKSIDCEEGGMSSGKLWNLKRKLNPKLRDPPTAMLDEAGNLISSNEKIKKLTIKAYSKRLESRPIKEDLKEMKELKEKLLKIRLKEARKRKTPPWTRERIVKVLKSLKTGKSRDPLGLANEIFHPDTAGEDLIDAIQILMNRIKEDQVHPEMMQYCNISSIYKGKGSRNEFNSYRGIFRITVFRNILDRLIYEDEYRTVDTGMSDSNIGSRKKRNIRDNIFVLGAVCNAVIKGDEEAIDN